MIKVDLYYFVSFLIVFNNSFSSTGFIYIWCLDIPGTIVNISSKISNAVIKRILIVGSIAFICWYN